MRNSLLYISSVHPGTLWIGTAWHWNLSRNKFPCCFTFHTTTGKNGLTFFERWRPFSCVQLLLKVLYDPTVPCELDYLCYQAFGGPKNRENGLNLYGGLLRPMTGTAASELARLASNLASSEYEPFTMIETCYRSTRLLFKLAATLVPEVIAFHISFVLIGTYWNFL